MATNPGPVTRLIDTPVGELFDDRDLDRVLRDLAEVASSWRVPGHDHALTRVLPSGIHRSTRRLAGFLLLPDRALLRRVLDHDVVDRFVSELVTRILAGYAAEQGARPGATSLLARVPVGKVTASLTDTVAAGIHAFARTHHPLILDYVVDTFTTVEHLPDMAAWRLHLVDVLWTTPLAEVLPRRQRVDPDATRAALADTARELRAELADRSILDLVVDLGFDAAAVRRLAATLDEVLARRT